MKIFRYTILLMLALIAGGNYVEAQTTSRIQSFNSARGSRTITRVQGSTRLVHYFSKPDNRNVFLFPPTSLNNSSVKRFIFPVESTPQGNIYYTINDIVIVGDMCYFCGKKKFENGYQYDLNNNIIIMYDSVGFVGRFSISNANSILKYTIRSINGTVNILRMDIHTDLNSDTLLAMVGVTNGVTKTSCLVFMNGAGSSWYYNVRKSTNTLETITDITFIEKHVVAVSKLQGEPQKFYLRSSEIDDINNYQYSALDNLKQYNTVSMYDPYSSPYSPTWHYDNVQMRLCRVSNDYDFYVAYESFLPNPLYGLAKNSISLYHMEISQANSNQINMLNAQLVRGDMVDTGTFVDIASVPYTNSTALLHQTTNSSATVKSILQLASWSTIGALSSLVSSTETLKSIDVLNNRYVYSAGNIPGNNDMIFKLYQDALYPSSSCLNSANLLALPLSLTATQDILATPLVQHHSESATWASGGTQVNVTNDIRSILCSQQQ